MENTQESVNNTTNNNRHSNSRRIASSIIVLIGGILFGVSFLNARIGYFAPMSIAAAVNFQLALYLMAFNFTSFIKRPVLKWESIPFLCGMACMCIACIYGYKEIRNYITFSECLHTNDRKCNAGDSYACNKIVDAALVSNSRYFAEHYLAKACAFEDKVSCAVIREYKFK